MSKHAQFAILKALSHGQTSASKIAKHAKMSLPYTLAQLQLLEAKNIIELTHESSHGVPGKPKKEYAIKQESTEVTIISNAAVVQHSFSNETITFFLNLLSHIPDDKQDLVSEYYWKHKKFLDKTTAIGFLSNDPKKIELIAFTTEDNLEKLRTKISNFTNDNELAVACWVHTPQEVAKGLEEKDHYYQSLRKKTKPIIDPEQIIGWMKHE